MKIAAAITAAVLACAATAASAATWNFSYTFGSNVLSGVIEGTLQGDNNTVLISNIENVVINGLAQAQHQNITTYSTYTNLGPTPPRVTLDGSAMDVLACQLPGGGCPYGFTFDTTATAAFWGSPPRFVFSYADAGSNNLLYDPQGWSMSAAVPEPESWALLIAGFGLTGAVLRRRRLAYTL